MNYPRSAYVHIPFCHRRCFYCDFPVVILGDKARGDYGPGSRTVQSYLKLLFREISLASKGTPLATIYIGGGTPSLLAPYQVADLLNHLNNQFGFQDGAEVSFEIDPASFNREELMGYIEAGVNRFSLGAQSFDNVMLSKIGRRHEFNHLIDSFNWINEFFLEGKLCSWSLDLIQNLPNQDIEAWKSQLEKVIDIAPPHVSIYDLSIENGTVFEWMQNRGELDLPDSDLSADIAILTSSMLKEAGFSRYEISNFALPGHTSRHNRVYWSGSEWWGFGQGATSFIGGKRFSRPRKSAEYKQWVKKQEVEGSEASLGSKRNSPIDLEDMLLTGLRRREGINFWQLANDWGWDKKQTHIFLNQLLIRWDDFIKGGLVKNYGERICLSDPEGMNLSNQILVEMILWWESLPKDAVEPPIL